MYNLGHALEDNTQNELVPAPEEGPMSSGMQDALRGRLERTEENSTRHASRWKGRNQWRKPGSLRLKWSPLTTMGREPIQERENIWFQSC